MKLTFLEAGVPLTKTYIKTKSGIDKTPYPMVYEVTSHEEDCDSLQSFATVLAKHAAAGHCLLKSNPARPLVNESRAGSTDRNAATDWIVLDVDGLPGVDSVEDFLKALGLADTSYVVQYSASYKVTSDDLRCHIFMMLDKSMAAPLVKQWLIQLNHQVSVLRDNMRLTKTGNALLWPLDVTACQADKLIYIAPPLLKGIKDPFAKTTRVGYVRKTHELLVIPNAINSTAQNKALTDKRINELRDELGFPARKITYKVHGNIEVMVKPDSCVITDMKVERGFVYFNLNGGDSWAYYHPEDNPNYIHNFKGEPVYLTKELLPEYWEELTQNATAQRSDGLTYLAFCDRKTGTYWRGTYDAGTDRLDLYQAKNETQVRHFAMQHGMPLGDYIPEWDMVFDPVESGVRVDSANRVVNTFEPTVYMKAVVKKTTKCPPTIFKVIHHALGEDVAITEHFMNWLAYILQFRDRSKTAWVLHGTTGTGKGILANKILRPLFGVNQTTMRRAEEFNEHYNGFMEKCFIVVVDEVETKALINERGFMAKVKNFVTEETITIREMYKGTHEVRNYTNWLFFSNKTDPVVIDKEDRRMNVGKYQPNKIASLAEVEDKILPAIDKELQGFHDYLMSYAVDTAAAGTPIETEDRNNMVSISESSLDTVSSAILEGNFEFLIDQLPSSNAYQANAMEMNRVENYKEVVKALLERTNETGACNISRDELRVIYDYAVGNVPGSPNKFTSMLKHHRIHTVKVWLGDRSVYGIKTTWRDYKRFGEYRKIFMPAQPAKPKLVKGA